VQRNVYNHTDCFALFCLSKPCNISPMKQAEFDRFADEYENRHRRNIAVTGENPEFFAEYKISQLATFVPELLATPPINPSFRAARSLTAFSTASRTPFPDSNWVTTWRAIPARITISPVCVHPGRKFRRDPYAR
jgi:hypothetical protein